MESVRHDVDTPDDLRLALILGVGPRTLAIAERISVSRRAQPPGTAGRPKGSEKDR